MTDPAAALRDALDVIREELEQFLPAGMLPASDQFPTAMEEAQAIVAAINWLGNRALPQPAAPQQQVMSQPPTGRR